jgi:hypothetical protein
MFAFKIKLNDFIAEKYPGTEKVIQRLSKVTVQDKNHLMPEFI